MTIVYLDPHIIMHTYIIHREVCYEDKYVALFMKVFICTGVLFFCFFFFLCRVTEITCNYLGETTTTTLV